jgi:hypothetical protein
LFPAASQPSFKALANLGHNFELHRSAGLLLDHGGAVSDATFSLDVLERIAGALQVHAWELLKPDV